MDHIKAAIYENSYILTLTPYQANIWVSNPKCPYSRKIICRCRDTLGWTLSIRPGTDLQQKDKSIVTRCLYGDETDTAINIHNSYNFIFKRFSYDNNNI